VWFIKKSSSKQLKLVSCDLKKGHTINYISGGSWDLSPCFFNCNFVLFSSSGNHSKKIFSQIWRYSKYESREKVLHTHPFHNGRQLWQFLTIFLKFHFWSFFFPWKKKKKNNREFVTECSLRIYFISQDGENSLPKNKIKITGLRIV